jgi:hypothetical protein
MGWKSILILPLARWTAASLKKKAGRAVEDQQKLRIQLVEKGKQTAFGKDHHFQDIQDYASFKSHVPVADYEQLRPYIERVVAGEEHVLWPGKPLYFAKTSGTTSGTKLIPISKASVPFHVGSARNAVFCYVAETGDASAFDGGMIFLSGSPILEKVGGILTGRLSGIVNHHIPGWIRKNQLPSWETNCIEDWETKLDAIVQETRRRDMRLIGGIPSWAQMYLDRLLAVTGKNKVKEIFPNLSVYVYGGVNYSPYRKKFEESLGESVKTIETYPASEGFIAFQDQQGEPGLLLQTWVGIFYEFIPAKEAHLSNPSRLSLEEVKLGENYALVLHTNAGLWGYLIGDTVKFVSLNPFRIVVTGRIKHFISAFGEHVIAEEVEGAMQEVLVGSMASVTEFHVAPLVQPSAGDLPGHDWLVEFDREPEDLLLFSKRLDEAMCRRNVYYKDLIEGKVTRSLRILPLKKGSFQAYMKAEGKLGGQHKVPRLADQRQMAEALLALQEKL